MNQKKTLDQLLAVTEKKIKAMRAAREKRKARLNRLLEDLENLVAEWEDDPGYEASELDSALQDLRKKVEEME